LTITFGTKREKSEKREKREKDEGLTCSSLFPRKHAFEIIRDKVSFNQLTLPQRISLLRDGLNDKYGRKWRRSGREAYKGRRSQRTLLTETLSDPSLLRAFVLI
jgi:hypothetical protein